ncbi:DUF4153 domain-containing protein [Lentibacter algarum]|uniref:DUF4153 domain-containing protein n=1 Tax=Lentibacter algarum TaxID=576131 RepID=UPI001C06FA9B|nr:DUF4153 domain-containing protein [Lentibacter algarum]MBU2981832.1 DUF4153 domain-containing protein [Lentibacter algarum]
MIKRLELTLIGGFSGLLLWVFIDYLPDLVSTGWALHCAAIFATVFCFSVLALVGPERPERALLPSAAIAVVVTLLTWMGGLRFTTSQEFFSAGHTVIALIAIVVISIPFAASNLQEKGGWRNYQRLFDGYWGVFIRFLAGSVFVGLIFLVLFLSDELLTLVGVRFIGDLLSKEIVVFTLWGAVFGLGIATVYELRDYVSPVLVHRLLRMLVPLVLVVVVIFLGALPLRGLTGLFGKLSTATVLMSVAFGAITLITTLIDRDDENAATTRFMVFSSRALAVLLPALVGLAVYAVWLRVAAYGWTPSRVIAAYAALFLSAYALYYAYAALKGGDWQQKLRQGNLYMALATCAGAVLWLTPLINAERLSAKSQLARFEAGETEVKDLPLYELAHDWGKPGEATLAALETSDNDALKEKIADARKAQSIWSFRREQDTVSLQNRREALAPRIAMRPQTAALSDILDGMPDYALRSFENNCPKATEPSCVILMLPENAMSQTRAVLISQKSRYPMNLVFQTDKYVIQGSVRFRKGTEVVGLPNDLFEKAMAGEFTVKPVTQEFLSFGDVLLVPNN